MVAAAAPTDAGFGLGRMWEVLAEETGWPTLIARDMSEAQKWLREKYREVFGEELPAIIDSGVVVPETSAGAT